MFSQNFNHAPALLPCAMLPRQAKHLTKPTALSKSILGSNLKLPADTLGLVCTSPSPSPTRRLFGLWVAFCSLHFVFFHSSDRPPLPSVLLPVSGLEGANPEKVISILGKVEGYVIAALGF